MRDLNELALSDLFGVLNPPANVAHLLDVALAEDLASIGDPTTESIIDAEDTARAVIVSRRPGVIAGLPIIQRLLIVAELSDAVSLTMTSQDGDRVQPGTMCARLEGGVGFMLIIERVMLNIIGRLSGIATLTRQFVDAIDGTNAVICDTRKTTPGLRGLEKYAVRCGGGTLHRFGLYDALLYKDNHLARIPQEELGLRLAGAIAAARAGNDLRFVEVEVDTLDQFDIILGLEPGSVDIVLLDNMAPALMVEAVRRRDARRPEMKLEASGDVTIETVRAVAETGVDRISVGALTHSAPALNVGLDIL